MPHAATAPAPDELLDDYRWLTSRAAAGWLATAAPDDSLTAQIARLRAALPPRRASLILQQLDLRRRARDKFAAAETMFFTAGGLEQATDEFIARYKSRRMPLGRRVVDLCSGIGGDLLALARRGETVGIDRDPVCVALAAANARAILEPSARPQLVCGDAAESDLSGCDAWHIDPDRRPRGRRTTRVELHDPDAETIERLLAANPHAAVKLAPAAEPPDVWHEQAELEWIGRARECRQLVAWFGRLAEHPGRRRATILDARGEVSRTVVGRADGGVPAAPRIERYVLEPHAAVLAAKLDAALAAEHGLAAVAPGIAYWTAGRPLADPALACFEVDDVLPLDVKRVKALLRRRRIGRLEIKLRGVGHNPAELRKRLRPAGDRAATLLVARIDRRVTAILARRVDAAGNGFGHPPAAAVEPAATGPAAPSARPAASAFR